jgi:hypothetical protein
MHPAKRFVPLHFYLLHALDLMYDHLRKGKALPSRARSLVAQLRAAARQRGQCRLEPEALSGFHGKHFERETMP